MRKAFTAILVLATIGLVILKVMTSYADKTGIARYAPAVGVGLLPWVVGLVVAVIKAGATRSGRTKRGFRDSFEGAVLVMLLILFALAVFRPAES